MSWRLTHPRTRLLQLAMNGHVQDVSGHGRHGDWATGTAGYTNGPFGRQVADLDGASAIRVQDEYDLSTFSEFSIGGWFRLDRLSTVAGFSQYLFAHRLDGAPWQPVQILQLSTNNRMAFTIVDSMGVASFQRSDAACVIGPWYHVMMTWDGLTILMFLDAVRQAETDTSGAPSGASPSASHIFGALSFTPSQPLDGQMFDWRIYNVALTPDEIADLYHFGRGA